MQIGDVYETFADTSKLRNTFAYEPKTSLAEGLQHFYDWYKDYFKIRYPAVFRKLRLN